ncbi:MAG: aldo/keto reductase [Planctomycetes bacterium]|nr:aldo/keto reductase [Planctomycetota bacterium]
MQRRKLGKTSLEVPVVCFGAWAIGGWYWGGSDDRDAVAAIRAACELGVDALDTAPVYGFGHSERVIGDALRGMTKKPLLMTKVGLRWDDARGPVFFESVDNQKNPVTVRRNLRADSVRFEVEQSLKRLGVEVLDLVQIHWPDPETPLAETLGALTELRKQGKVRELGVSNFTTAMLDEAQRLLGTVPLASTQERFSALSRGLEHEILPWVRRQHVGVLAYSPLEQGLLTGKLTPERQLAADDGRLRKGQFQPESRAQINARLAEVVGPIAKARGATIGQVVLAATLAQPGVTAVLVGARNADQARENAKAGELSLAPNEVAAVWNGLANFEFGGGSVVGRVLKKLGFGR